MAKTLKEIFEGIPYSSAASGKRKREIEYQTNPPAPESIEQFQHEKDVGAPGTEGGYEAWKDQKKGY